MDSSQIIGWLLSQAGGKVVNEILDTLAIIAGLKSRPLTDKNAKVLLDEYHQRVQNSLKQDVIAKLDEDRLAILGSGIDDLQSLARSKHKEKLAWSASYNFSLIAKLPEQGETGGFKNSELRSIGYLGKAVARIALNDTKEEIAYCVAQAVSMDTATAEKWLGIKIVDELKQHANLPNASPQPPVPNAPPSQGSTIPVPPQPVPQPPVVPPAPPLPPIVPPLPPTPPHRFSKRKSIILITLAVLILGSSFLLYKTVFLSPQRFSMFVGQNTRTLYSVNSDDGSLSWKYLTGNYITNIQESNGVVFVATQESNFLDSFTNNGLAYVLAVNSVDGTLKWKYQLPSGIKPHLILDQENVYAYDFLGGKDVIALNQSDGSLRWQYATSDSYSILQASDGIVCLVTDTGIIQGLSQSDGSLAWTYQGTQYEYPVFTNGKVYFSKDNGIQALNLADGNSSWNSQIGDDPLISAGNGVIYGVSLSRYVYALDASNGSLLWKQQVLLPNSKSLEAPFYFDGVVYINSTNIYAINANDGSLRWRLDGTAGSLSSIDLSNGTFFVNEAGSNKIDEIATSDGTVRQPYNVDGKIDSFNVANDIFYIISSSNGDFYLRALNTNDGTLRWQKDLGKDA